MSVVGSQDSQNLLNENIRVRESSIKNSRAQSLSRLRSPMPSMTDTGLEAKPSTKPQSTEFNPFKKYDKGDLSQFIEYEDNHSKKRKMIAISAEKQKYYFKNLPKSFDATQKILCRLKNSIYLPELQKNKDRSSDSDIFRSLKNHSKDRSHKILDFETPFQKETVIRLEDSCRTPYTEKNPSSSVLRSPIKLVKKPNPFLYQSNKTQKQKSCLNTPLSRKYLSEKKLLSLEESPLLPEVSIPSSSRFLANLQKKAPTKGHQPHHSLQLPTMQPESNSSKVLPRKATFLTVSPLGEPSRAAQESAFNL